VFVFTGEWLLSMARLRFFGPYALAAVAIALGVLTMLRNEEYRSRVTVWERSLAKMPDSVRARTNTGQALLVEDRFEEALPILERGLELSPYDPFILQNLAYAYELKGDYASYARCNEKLRDANPDDAGHCQTFAASLLLFGKWEEAASAYKKAGELKPDSAEPHYGRAAALFALGRDAEAEEEAKAATAIDPKWPEAVFDLARSVILDERKRGHSIARQSALTWAKLGLQFTPSPTARQRDTLGLCYAAQGEFLQAGAQSISALEENPGSDWTSIHRDRLRLYGERRTPWPEK